MNSEPEFPSKRTVQPGTSACLTSEFEMGSGRTRPLWPFIVIKEADTFYKSIVTIGGPI